MHILVYTADEAVMDHVASAMRLIKRGNDTLTCIDSPNFFIGYMEDWGNTVDVLITEPDTLNFSSEEILPYIRESHPALQLVYLFSGKPIVFANHSIPHSALLPVPLDRGVMMKVMNECRMRSAGQRSAGLFVSDRNVTAYIPFGSILYIESEMRGARIFTDRGALTVSESLSSIERRLDSRFIKCHQSFTVNVNFVRMYICDPADVNYACLELSNGDRIPVSVRKQKQTKSFFAQYCSNLPHESTGYLIKRT